MITIIQALPGPETDDPVPKVAGGWQMGQTITRFAGEANSKIDTSRERTREADVPAPAIKRRRPMVAKVRKIDVNPRHFAVAPDGDVAGWRSRLKELFGTADDEIICPMNARSS
jgi:hypothetical protein